MNEKATHAGILPQFGGGASQLTNRATACMGSPWLLKLSVASGMYQASGRLADETRVRDERAARIPSRGSSVSQDKNGTGSARRRGDGKEESRRRTWRATPAAE